MSYNFRHNDHSFSLNKNTLIAVIVVCIALVLSAFFNYMSKIEEAKQLAETMKATSEMYKMIKPPTESPAANTQSVPVSPEPPTQLPKYTP